MTKTGLLSFLRLRTSPLSVLVTGMPKSGSTILYHSIKKALPEDAVCLFEPEHKKLLLPKPLTKPALVKSFIPYSRNFNNLKKKILLVRDPRDQLISTILYWPYLVIVNAKFGSDEKTQEYLDRMFNLLHRKEQDPGSIPLKEIYELYIRWPAEGFGSHLMEYYKERPDLFLYKYEDFIDGKLGELSHYIGLPIEKANEVDQKRVTRSKAYGNWKDWFTPSDVHYFRPHYKPFMDYFGYPDEWEMNPNQKIDPQVTSRYVEYLVGQAREFMAGK